MKNAFEDIKTGLREAIEHARVRSPETRVHKPKAADDGVLQAHGTQSCVG